MEKANKAKPFREPQNRHTKYDVRTSLILDGKGICNEVPDHMTSDHLTE